MVGKADIVLAISMRAVTFVAERVKLSCSALILVMLLDV